MFAHSLQLLWNQKPYFTVTLSNPVAAALRHGHYRLHVDTRRLLFEIEELGHELSSALAPPTPLLTKGRPSAPELRVEPLEVPPFPSHHPPPLPPARRICAPRGLASILCECWAGRSF